MKFLFFGRLRDEIGADQIESSVPARITDSEALREWVGAEHPTLLDARVRIALDDVLASGAMPIKGVTEVAFLPPVSGG